VKSLNRVTSLLTGYWLPLLGGGLLVLACLGPDARSAMSDPVGRQIGALLSGPIYLAYLVLSLGLLILLSIRQRKDHMSWWALDVSTVTFLLVQGLKLAVRLPRPSGSPSGFPSGHTTFAFALAWLMLTACPRLAPLWFGLAVGIGWSRVEIQDHFTYQVLVGAALGCALGWLTSHRRGGVVFPRCLRLGQDPPSF